MKNVIRILIASADEQLVQTVLDIEKYSPQFFCVGEFYTGKGLLQAVRRERPDIVLLDDALPDFDSLSFLYALNRLSVDWRPTIFLFSDALPRTMQMEFGRLGVDFLLRRSTKPHILIDLIRQYAISPAAAFLRCCRSEAETPELCVSRLLHRYQIPVHLMGYRYLRECVLAVMEDEELAISMTKVLYPQIARRHNTSWSCVERNIRSAIRHARKNTSHENMEIWQSCQTNRTLILQIVRLARMEMRRFGIAEPHWDEERRGNSAD